MPCAPQALLLHVTSVYGPGSQARPGKVEQSRYTLFQTTSSTGTMTAVSRASLTQHTERDPASSRRPPAYTPARNPSDRRLRWLTHSRQSKLNAHIGDDFSTSDRIHYDQSAIRRDPDLRGKGLTANGTASTG